MPEEIVTIKSKNSNGDIHIPIAVKAIIIFVGSLSLIISLVYTIDLCIKSSASDNLNIPFLPFLNEHPEYLATAKGVVIDLGKILFSAIGFAYLRRRHLAWAALLLPVAIIGAIISILATTGAFHSTEDQAESDLRKNSTEYLNAKSKVEGIKSQLNTELLIQSNKLKELKNTKYKTNTQKDFDNSRESASSLRYQLSEAQKELNGTNPKDKTTQQSLYEGIQKTLSMIPFIHINADISTIKNIFVFAVSLLIDWIGMACFMVCDFRFGIKFNDDQDNLSPTLPDNDKEKKIIKENDLKIEKNTRNFIEKKEQKVMLGSMKISHTQDGFRDGFRSSQNALSNPSRTRLEPLSKETVRDVPPPIPGRGKFNKLTVHAQDGSETVVDRRGGYRKTTSKLPKKTRTPTYENVKDFIIKRPQEKWSITAIKNRCGVGFSTAKKFYEKMQEDGVLEKNGDYSTVKKVI